MSDIEPLLNAAKPQADSRWAVDAKGVVSTDGVDPGPEYILIPTTSPPLWPLFWEMVTLDPAYRHPTTELD